MESSCSKGTRNSFMYLEAKLFRRNKEISMYVEIKLLIGTWGFHVPPVDVDKVVTYPEGTPYNGPYGEAPPKKNILFRLHVYRRVGIYLLKYMKG